MRTTRAIALTCLFVGFSADSSFAQQEKSIDKKILTVGAGLMLSTAYDIETTLRGLNSCLGCREANPIALVSRNRATAYAVGTAVNAGVMYAAYRFKKKNHKAWWIFPVVVTAVHAIAGSSNLRFIR